MSRPSRSRVAIQPTGRGATIAEKALLAAEAQSTSIEARIAADRAHYLSSQSGVTTAEPASGSESPATKELCSAAGKFEGGGQQYLVGLICCAAGPNSLGEMTVDKPGQWLSILRVRNAA